MKLYIDSLMRGRQFEKLIDRTKRETEKYGKNPSCRTPVMLLDIALEARRSIYLSMLI